MERQYDAVFFSDKWLASGCRMDAIMQRARASTCCGEVLVRFVAYIILRNRRRWRFPSRWIVIHHALFPVVDALVLRSLPLPSFALVRSPTVCALLAI